MKLKLESILTCHSCKRQEQEKIPFNLGDDAEKMAKIVEGSLLRRHMKDNPECISSPEFTMTSRIVNTETNQVVRLVESGLDVEMVLNDLDLEPIAEDFLEDHSVSLAEPANPAGYVYDF